jgi:hypothetical protein
LIMTAQPSASIFNIDGASYPAGTGQTAKDNIDFNKEIPNARIGLGKTQKNSGLSFTNDFGIMFQGSPKSSSITNIAGLAAADIYKANSDLNSSLNNFKTYPFISVGVGYTF